MSFNEDEPIAFFITWACYGTWLPGDERGWYRWCKGELQPPNPMVKEMAAAKMKETEFVMSPADRQIVERTITDHCRIRRWTLHAVNARSNHTHVVVTAPGYHPKTVREQFKAWCTRRLKRRHLKRERFWTEGGSCPSLNTDDELEGAVIYVIDAQDWK